MMIMEERLRRVENLRRLVTETGGPAKFARRYDGVDPTYVSQLLNGYRNFGEKAARKMEEQVGLPRGWMDREVKSSGEDATRLPDKQSEDNAAAVSKAGLPHPSPATKRLLSLIKGRSERQILRITKALEMLFEASEKEQPEEDELVVHLGKRRQLDSSRNANHHK